MDIKTLLCLAVFFICGIDLSAATSGHRKLHRQFENRHAHNRLPGRSFEAELTSPESEEANNASGLKRRGSGCSLPDDDSNLVRITDQRNDNKGFAMSPDQPCEDGMYCPFACKPGMLMNQWKDGTSFVVGESMKGGLYCDNGTPKKPFPNRANCVQGTGTVKAVNECGKLVSFCQTVLPGNEAMLIPTEVSGTTTLAVPGPDYWAGTAAHYYINPPGVSASEGCRWGTEDKNVGNWSPFVAGANTVSDGKTYVQLSWNPIYEASKWASTKPDFGVKIECDGDCNGLPCEIDPSKTGLKGVNSKTAAVGAGVAAFCVVTVDKGSSARIVVFSTGESSEDDESSSSSTEQPKQTSTTAEKPSSTVDSSKSSSKSEWHETSSSSSRFTLPTVRPGIFQENVTSSTSSFQSRPTMTPGSSTGSATLSAASPSSTNDSNNMDKGGAAIAGFIVAVFAAAWMY